MTTFSKFFPKGRDISLVFGVILFVVHSWSLRTFLYNFPSFILYMNIGQVAVVFAYMMAFAFVESLLIMLGLILISAILPRGWYRGEFASKGSLTVLVGAVLAINIRMSMPNHYPGVEFLYWRVLISLAVLISAILATHFFRPFQKAINFMVEQISIMLYLYAPIGILSLIVVFARNLF